MVSEILYQVTDNRMRFSEHIIHKFMKEVKGKKTIFVKPNIVSYEPSPTTTHPDVLRYVLKNLPRDSDVVIADAPAVDAGNSKKIIKDHPLSKVCSQLSFELENLYDFGFKKVRTKSGFDLNVSKLAFDCDYMISLPVMKAHCLKNIGITGALKNNFGLISAKDRILLHSTGRIHSRAVRRVFRIKKDINLAIAELNVIRKPDLFIVDMVDTLINANEVRHGGIQKHVGLMFAGKDPVALDCFGLEILKKFDHGLKEKEAEDIPAINYALRLGVGEKKFKKSKIKD
ncbi:MAG: DUF362 domain-containing protein [Candidatus Aenigmatarchaeota archaeon]|nr:MAG: DUF362 domain-containing protein [Candidatus Aenigmarchaeota archaeon]